MAERGIRARLEQLAVRARESFRLYAPGPEPGSAEWLRELAADIDQAKRNEADREDVVTRRRSTIRRASEEARPAERLALAEIESMSGLPQQAKARLLDVLGNGPLPPATVSFAPSLVSRLADEEDRQAEAVGLFETALAASGDAREASIALLSGKARLHVRQQAPHAAEQAATEGLRQLGWGVGPDPYRGIAERRLELDEFEMEALVSLVSSLATAMSYSGAFDDASQQLSDLRAFLQTSTVGQLYEQDLSVTEAWLDHRRGDFSAAERKLGAAYDHAAAMDAHENQRGVTILTNLGWTYLELDLVEQASGAAKVAADIVERRALQDRESVVRGLQAEVALRRGDLERAEALAEQGVDQADRLRILAACALARGEDEDALRLAKESVELATGALGGDVTDFDALLLLARAAARSDRQLADDTLKRAASIPMPADHPYRERIERVRAELLL